nr:hypothetical protein [Thalassomonas viridans]
MFVEVMNRLTQAAVFLHISLDQMMISPLPDLCHHRQGVLPMMAQPLGCAKLFLNTFIFMQPNFSMALNDEVHLIWEMALHIIKLLSGMAITKSLPGLYYAWPITRQRVTHDPRGGADVSRCCKMLSINSPA